MTRTKIEKTQVGEFTYHFHWGFSSPKHELHNNYCNWPLPYYMRNKFRLFVCLQEPGNAAFGAVFVSGVFTFTRIFAQPISGTTPSQNKLLIRYQSHQSYSPIHNPSASWGWLRFTIKCNILSWRKKFALLEDCNHQAKERCGYRTNHSGDALSLNRIPQNKCIQLICCQYCQVLAWNDHHCRLGPPGVIHGGMRSLRRPPPKHNSSHIEIW